LDTLLTQGARRARPSHGSVLPTYSWRDFFVQAVKVNRTPLYELSHSKTTAALACLTHDNRVLRLASNVSLPCGTRICNRATDTRTTI